MRRHHKRRPGLYPGLEGNHLAGKELFPGLEALGIAKMGVCLGVSVAGEVLDAAINTGIRQALEVFYHLPGRIRGVF